MGKLVLALALGLLLSTVQTNAQCDGDFRLVDLFYLRVLYNTFLPILRQRYATRTQFAAMGFDFAGFNPGTENGFLPPDLRMETRDRTNYAMATFRNYYDPDEEHRSQYPRRYHAEENLMWAITNGGMLERYRELYGFYPATIHLFTARTPCRNCTDILIRILNEHAPNSEIYIGFSEPPDASELMSVEYAQQQFGNHPRFHFFPNMVCEYLDNYFQEPTEDTEETGRYIGEATPPPHDELRRRRSATADETCPISPNMYRRIDGHGYSLTSTPDCVPPCDADVSCAGIIFGSAGWGTPELCLSFSAENKTLIERSFTGMVGSIYAKVAYPEPGFWFIMRSRVFGYCLSSLRNAGNKLYSATCDSEHEDQHFAVLSTQSIYVTIKTRNTDMCIEKSGPDAVPTTAPCNDQKLEQQWQVAVQRKATRYTRLVNRRHGGRFYDDVYNGHLWDLDLVKAEPPEWFTIQGEYGCLFSRSSDDKFSWETECRPDHQDQWFREWHPTEDSTMLKSKDTGKCIAATGKWDLTHASCDANSDKQRWKKCGGLLESKSYGTCVYHYYKLRMAHCNTETAYQRWKFNKVLTRIFGTQAFDHPSPILWFTIKGEYGCLFSRSRDDKLSWETECVPLGPDHSDHLFRVWHPTEDSTMLKSKDTGKCIAATGKWDLTHASCDAESDKQRWKKHRNGLLESKFYGKCVYHYYKLRMANCNSQTAYQRWEFKLIAKGLSDSC